MLWLSSCMPLHPAWQIPCVCKMLSLLEDMFFFALWLWITAYDTRCQASQHHNKKKSKLLEPLGLPRTVSRTKLVLRECMSGLHLCCHCWGGRLFMVHVSCLLNSSGIVFFYLKSADLTFLVSGQSSKQASKQASKQTYTCMCTMIVPIVWPWTNQVPQDRSCDCV